MRTLLKKGTMQGPPTRAVLNQLQSTLLLLICSLRGHWFDPKTTQQFCARCDSFIP